MKNISYTCDTCQKSSEDMRKPMKWIHVSYIDIQKSDAYDEPIIIKNGISGDYCSRNCLLVKIAL